MGDVKAEITQYGFQFGAAKVERFASHKGYVVIGLTTPKHRLEITVTPTGIIRVLVPQKLKR